MNKKLLIGAAIATALLISACVKKETPKDDAETQEQVASQPAQFQDLNSVESSNTTSVEIPTQVQNEPTLQENPQPAPTTQSHTQNNPAPAYVSTPEPIPAAKPTVETPKTEASPATKPAVTEAIKPIAQQANTVAKAQSEDDAVAAAMAAAAPALKN